MSKSTVKRLLGLLLAVVTVLTMMSVIAGCGEGGSGYDVNGKKDFEGRVFKIGAWWDRTPIEGKTEWDDAFAKKIKEIEDTCNCRIEFVTIGNVNGEEYVTTNLAGDPVCDIATVLSYYILPGYIQGGIAYPMSDLASFDFTDYKWLQSAINFGTYQGKVYTMDLKWADDNGCRYGVFYDKTIFNEQGLPDLETLYKNGEWTWDKMLEVAKSVNCDPNGDGEMDLYALGCWDLIWNLITSNGADVFDNDNGKINASGFSQPAVVEAMDFAAKLGSELGVMGSENLMAKFMPFDCSDAFKANVIAMAITEWWETEKFQVSEGNRLKANAYGFVPFPLGPQANGTYYSYGKEMSPYIMLSQTKNPEDVAWMFNAITDCAESDAQWDEWLISRQELRADDSDSVTNVMDMTAAGNTKINPLVGYTDLYDTVTEMFDAILNGELTTQVALETYSQEIAGAVEKANNTNWSEIFEKEYQEMLDEKIANTIDENTPLEQLSVEGANGLAIYCTDNTNWVFDTTEAPEICDGDAATVHTMNRTLTAWDFYQVNLNTFPQTFQKVVVKAGAAGSLPDEATGVKLIYNYQNEWVDVTTACQANITYSDDEIVFVLSKPLESTGIQVQVLADNAATTWSVSEIELYRIATDDE